MRIVNWGKAKQFVTRFPRAEAPLNHWKRAVKDGRWKNFVEITQSFNSADQVGEYTVFDIGGNNFRLIAIIIFRCETVYIRHVLTHAEYEKGKWRK